MGTVRDIGAGDIVRLMFCSPARSFAMFWAICSCLQQAAFAWQQAVQAVLARRQDAPA
jgi:hypothetical protein